MHLAGTTIEDYICMSIVSTNWKKLSKKLLVQNKFVELWDEEVQRPDGKTSHYFVNRRSDFSLIIPAEGESYYLVKQYRYPIEEVTIEFPMGYVEGKSPYESADIELREETGIRAQSLKELGNFCVGVGRTDQKCHVYLAEGLEFGTSDPDEGEFIEVIKVSYADIEKMIDSGEIKESCSIVAFHYLERYYKVQKK